MDCSEFLDSYSEFRDGVITDPERLRRLREHCARCLPCSRYDATVRHGLDAVGEIEPSADFRERLRARIAAEGQPIEQVGRGGAGLAAGLMLAAAIALLVYEGSRHKEQLPEPVAISRPRPNVLAGARTGSDLWAPPLVIVNPSMPFLTFTDLSVSPFHTAGQFHAQSDIPLGTWTNLPR